MHIFRHVLTLIPKNQNFFSQDFEKPKKYFRLIMNKVAWNVEKSGFQKNFEKILT